MHDYWALEACESDKFLMLVPKREWPTYSLGFFCCVKYNIANNALPLCLDGHNPSSLTNQVNSITNRFENFEIHSIPGTVYPLPRLSI